MTRQLPFSASQAINASVKGLRDLPESYNKSALTALKHLAKNKLDRPTKGIQEGWFATTAKKNNLKSVISPKSKFKGRDGKDKGWNRSRYFVGNIKGGDRPDKWIELEARKLGSLPSNLDLVPTREKKGGIERDRYGNPKRRKVQKLFENVGIGKTFIGKPENTTRPYGIYKVTPKGLKAQFVAVSSTSYPRPLDNIELVVYRRVDRTFGPYLRKLLDNNVKKALQAGLAR